MQRLKQRYKIEMLRLAIARDLHDDVGAALGSINILSKTATRKLKKNAAQQDINTIFQKNGQSAENTLEAIDDIVWSINPNKDKLEDLIILMREYAIPLLEARNIKFYFDIQGTTEQQIAMDLRCNLFLIFKEAVHNVLKHAQAKNVFIELLTQHHQIILSVKDDGVGFDSTIATNRNGLKNMHQRVALSKGALTIESSKDGSNIIFAAPIR